MIHGEDTFTGTEPLTHARIAHSGTWLSGTVTASGTDSGSFFAEAPNNSLTYERWKPDAAPWSWELAPAAATSIDYCCIAGHTTTGWTFTVQQFDGAWSDITGATNITVTSTEPVYVFLNNVSASNTSYRITGTDTPEIAVIRFGSALEMPRPIYGGHSPLKLARQTTMRSNQSAQGEWLGRTKQRVMLATSFAWQNIEAAWVRANWYPAQLAMETEPFFIAWRPETFDEVGYCYINQPSAVSNQGVRDLMSVELEVIGYADA